MHVIQMTNVHTMVSVAMFSVHCPTVELEELMVHRIHHFHTSHSLSMYCRSAIHSGSGALYRF